MLLRFLGVVALSLGIAGCAHEAASSRFPRSDDANAALGPAPSGEPSGAPETQDGQATYYSDSLSGHPTASGEPYDPNALTAAHRKWPFGTRVRVTRTDTGRSVIVRVNDRGPFGSQKRVIDLSHGAAKELDMLRAGVVSVRLEVLEWGAGRR